VADERAVELVDYLLKHPPDEAIHASELESLVDGGSVIDGVAAIEPEGWRGGEISDVATTVLEGAGRALMGNTGTLLKRELAEQRSIRDDATLPEAEREAASQRIQELLKAHQRGGKMAGNATRSVDRVRKAIKTFIRELKNAQLRRGEPNVVLRAFGEHLEEYLWKASMGGRGRAGAAGRPGCFTYEPPAGVVWKD